MRFLKLAVVFLLIALMVVSIVAAQRGTITTDDEPGFFARLLSFGKKVDVDTAEDMDKLRDYGDGSDTSDEIITSARSMVQVAGIALPGNHEKLPEEDFSAAQAETMFQYVAQNIDTMTDDEIKGVMYVQSIQIAQLTALNEELMAQVSQLIEDMERLSGTGDEDEIIS